MRKIGLVKSNLVKKDNNFFQELGQHLLKKGAVLAIKGGGSMRIVNCKLNSSSKATLTSMSDNKH